MKTAWSESCFSHAQITAMNPLRHGCQQSVTVADDDTNLSSTICHRGLFILCGCCYNLEVRVHSNSYKIIWKVCDLHWSSNFNQNSNLSFRFSDCRSLQICGCHKCLFSFCLCFTLICFALPQHVLTCNKTVYVQHFIPRQVDAVETQVSFSPLFRSASSWAMRQLVVLQTRNKPVTFFVLAKLSYCNFQKLFFGRFQNFFCNL